LNLRKCRNKDCSYLVAIGEKFCPGCGLVRPYYRTAKLRYSALEILLAGVSLFFIVEVTIVIIAIKLGSPIQGLPLFELVFAVSVPLLITIIMGYRYLYLRRSGKSLSDIERKVKLRTDEIVAKLDQVTDTLRMVEAEKGDDWRTTENILRNRLLSLCQHKDEYTIKHVEIMTARWQNALLPASNIENVLSYQSAAERVSKLDDSIRHGASLIGQMRPLARVPSGASLVEKIRAILSSCEKLRQEILARQAALAIEGTGNLTDVLNPISVPNKHDREHFNFVALVDMQNLADEFNRLEHSYLSLQVEDDTSSMIGDTVANAQRTFE